MRSQEKWLGWFPATMDSFLVGTVFGSLVICTTSAWLAGSVRRSGLTEWTAATARGVKGVYRQPIVVCALLGAAAYTITFVTMTVMTLSRATDQPVQSPGLSIVLLIAWVSSAAWAAVGATLGRFLRSEIAIPLALIVSYASYVLPEFYLFTTPLLGATLTDGRVWLTLQPGDWQLAAKLLLWCGITVFFTAAVTSMRRMLAAGAWLGVAGLTAVAFLGSTLTPIPDASDRVCTGDELRVCTDRAHAVVLAEFHSVTSNALKILPESLRPRLLDQTAKPKQDVLQVVPVNDNTAPALTIDREATITSLGEAIFYRCPQSRQEGALVAASLDAWWRIEHGISTQEKITPSGAPWLYLPDLSEAPERGRELANLTSVEQHHWFEENSRAIEDCAFGNVVWP